MSEAITAAIIGAAATLIAVVVQVIRKKQPKNTPLERDGDCSINDVSGNIAFSYKQTGGITANTVNIDTQDPIGNCGPRAKELAKTLYSLIQELPQNRLSTHIDWTPTLNPLVKELSCFESEGFLTGSHVMSGPDADFNKGFRLDNPHFIILLAELYDDPKKIARLIEIMEAATSQLDGVELQKSIGLPLTVIDAFFEKYAKRKQGLKSKENGRSIYIPKPLR